MSIEKRFLRLIYPPKCILCGRLLEKDETDLCHSCRLDSPVYTGSRIKLPFIDGWTAVWRYDGPVRESILRFKFHRKRVYAESYGRLLAMKILQEFPEGFDCLAWVPVSRWRKFRRGYDQVELLADAVGRELDMEPVKLLRKIRNHRVQSSIVGEAQRRANVLGAYRAENTELLREKRILLLDDVITTGATLGECARVLLTAGAKEIYCAAVATARHNDKKSR